MIHAILTIPQALPPTIKKVLLLLGPSILLGAVMLCWPSIKWPVVALVAVVTVAIFARKAWVAFLRPNHQQMVMSYLTEEVDEFQVRENSLFPERSSGNDPVKDFAITFTGNVGLHEIYEKLTLHYDVDHGLQIVPMRDEEHKMSFDAKPHKDVPGYTYQVCIRSHKERPETYRIRVVRV